MNRIKNHKALILSLIVLLGLVLRVRELGRVGFNEDEIQKVNAAHAYLHGNFFVNLEHPMLMKSLITVSLAAAEHWNRQLEHSHRISEEFAVRLPNVIFGSLTAVVIFLFAQECFGLEVGLLSAFLWSVGIIAITINREAKEDTLLVFFTWLAYYFYVRAKKLSAQGSYQASKYFVASGASFGLMLASKYFPHYLGLIFLYYWLFRNKEMFPPRRRRETYLLLGACAMVVVLADPVILFPRTISYMLHYITEGTMTHRGYLMMGHLYYDDPAHLTGGMPVYFYALFLAIKTQLPILAAFVVGLVEVFRRRREAGAFFLIVMFLFWIVPFSLLSAKWIRYMLAWMPTVYMIAAIGMVKIFSWLSTQARRELSRPPAPALAAALAMLFFVVPVWVSLKSGPYYSLYLNPLGFGRTGYYFPHDEMNDAGLRTAIKEICEEAAEGASVGGETEPVFKYYFHRFGRDDLHYFDLSDQAQRMSAPPSAYLVIQDGRIYFDNSAFIQTVEAYQHPIQTFDIRGAAAARVYRDEEFAELRPVR
jgi:Dolichyl-phosphate-mannose-protein mannosyltransferase